MSRIPREARDGLMRAWLEILRDRHPQVTWIAADNEMAVSSAGEKQPKTQASVPVLRAAA
jgi:hypothetical protein